MSILEHMNPDALKRMKSTSVPLVESAVTHTKTNIQNDKNLNKKDKKILNKLIENAGLYYKLLKEDSGVSVDAVGNMISFAFPIVKKMFPGLIAKDLISVQPIDAPVGFVRFLRYVRTGGKDPYTSEAIMPENFLDNTYQPNYASQEITTTITTSITGGAPGTVADIAGDFTESYSNYGTILFAEPNTQQMREADDNVKATIKYFSFSDTSHYDINNFTVTQDAGHYILDDGTNKITFTVNSGDGTIDAAIDSGFANDVTITAVLNAFVNLEANSNTNTGKEEIPEYKFHIEYKEVYTKPKALRSNIDLQAMLISQKAGVEADTELIDLISSAMALEIDRGIIADLRNMAKHESAVTPGSFSKGLPSNWATSPAFYYTFLIKEMNVLSANIYKTSLRGKAGWAVTTPEIAALLEITEMFSSNENYAGANTLTMAGKLKQNQISVYVDPYYPDNEMMLGFKGLGTNAGYVFAPFIPLALTPPDFRGQDFSFSYGAFSQQGSAKVDANIVGYIDITD